MRIRIVHDTVYTYEQPARGLIQLMRLTPRDHDGQHVREWRIEPSVNGRLTAREDGFGNLVHWFTADEPTDALTVRVTGEIETFETSGIVRGAVERLPDLFYLRDTPLTEASPELKAFAEKVAAGKGERDPLSVLHRLLAAVRQELKLVQGVTAEPAFAHVVRWDRAIPQYLVGHNARVARIDRLAGRHPGLFLTGNAYHGVALNDCTEQAEQIAARVSNFLTTAGNGM